MQPELLGLLALLATPRTVTGGPAPTPVCRGSSGGSITVGWESASGGGRQSDVVAARLHRHPGALPFALMTAESSSDAMTIEGLRPSKQYWVSLRAHAAGAASMAAGWGNASSAVACSTTAAGAAATAGVRRRGNPQSRSQFTLMLRESEYTDQVDFLDNHNAADTLGLAAFVTNTVHGPLNRTGAAFAAVPITQYCVEHVLPVPLEQNGGFAQYASCNAPEAGCYPVPGWEQRCPLSLPLCSCWNVSALAHTRLCLYRPRSLTCLCRQYPDRIIGHQTLSEVEGQCGVCARSDPESPPHCSNPPTYGNDGELDGHFVQCNCSTAPGINATRLLDDSPTANFVGRAPVYLPYGPPPGPWIAPPSYPVSKRCGNNFSLLKRRSCAEGKPLGTGGCTWRRMPLARIMYGAELTAAGWREAEPHGHRNNTNATDATLANAVVLEKMFAGDEWMEPLSAIC